MLTTIITHAVALLVGAGGGVYAWSKYKAKAAADLASVSKKIGG